MKKEDDGDGKGSENQQSRTPPANRDSAQPNHEDHGAKVLPQHQGEVLLKAGEIPAFMKALDATPKAPEPGDEGRN
jgi:hypothetical protein